MISPNSHKCLTCWDTVRGGPLLRMDAANTEPVREWGCTSLLPLATNKRGTDTFCAPGCDNEAVEKVRGSQNASWEADNLQQIPSVKFSEHRVEKQ